MAAAVHRNVGWLLCVILFLLEIDSTVSVGRMHVSDFVRTDESLGGLSKFKRKSMDEYVHYETCLPQVFNSDNGLLVQLNAAMNKPFKNISVMFMAYGRNFIIDLNLNMNMFGKSYVEKIIKGPGQEKSLTKGYATLNESQCYYHGALRGHLQTSSAAISTCHGIRGQISTDDDVYMIEPSSTQSNIHHVYKQSESRHNNFSCGHDRGDQPSSHLNQKSKSKSKPNTRERQVRLRRSSNSTHSERRFIEPYNPLTTTRIVELYIVNDVAQYNSLNNDVNEVIQRTKDIVNIVSSIYQPLGIYVVLVGVEIWTERNRIPISGNADDTMNAFIEYRRNFINPYHRNDNAQLIIGENLGDGVLGKAPILTICTHQFSGGVNADRSSSIAPIATTIAHELGHNFGMVHDSDSCSCPDDRCVMSASGSGRRNPTRWSECSKQQLAETLHQGMDYCLKDIPDTLYGTSICGNGFTEEGEDCDCGLEQDCKNKCCDAVSCKIKANATCAAGWCCDLDTCKPKPATTECRSSVGMCDLAEYCNGKSEHCPSDVHVFDGSTCRNVEGESYCYKGACNTHDAQCKLLWGASGQVSSPLCYEHFNIMGTANGHCGFDWVNRTFQKCVPEDVLCGMLHCQHRSEKLMFWKEALLYTLPDTYVMVDGRREDCKAAILDVGLDMPNPSMALDGAKCGHNKVCVSNRCVALSDSSPPQCGRCSGRGVCNSLGQCHCDRGYAPPTCLLAGMGGSEHSGATHSNQDNIGLVLGMSVLFLLLLLLLSALAIFIYNRRDRIHEFVMKKCSDRFFRYGSVPTTNGHSEVHIPPSNCVIESAIFTTNMPTIKLCRAPSRASSFRTVDISYPTLQSSTNRSVDHLSTVNLIPPRSPEMSCPKLPPIRNYNDRRPKLNTEPNTSSPIGNAKIPNRKLLPFPKPCYDDIEDEGLFVPLTAAFDSKVCIFSSSSIADKKNTKLAAGRKLNNDPRSSRVSTIVPTRNAPPPPFQNSEGPPPPPQQKMKIDEVRQPRETGDNQYRLLKNHPHLQTTSAHLSSKNNVKTTQSGNRSIETVHNIAAEGKINYLNKSPCVSHSSGLNLSPPNFEINNDVTLLKSTACRNEVLNSEKSQPETKACIYNGSEKIISGAENSVCRKNENANVIRALSIKPPVPPKPKPNN